MRSLILLALIGTAFAVPQVSQRIVGGSDTTIQAYPFMTDLQYLWFGMLWSSSCGGSLLTSRTLLTAAHCVIGDPANSWRARVGSTDRSAGDIYNFASIIVHPAYTNAAINCDVAVASLATPVAFSDRVGAARIAGPNYVLPDNTKLTAVGWGTLYSGGPASTILQHVDVDLINLDVCRERYSNAGNMPAVTEYMVCAGILDVGGKDACQGDSGGPLLHAGTDVVYGVTSWGAGCADAYYPGVNAAVNKLADWITAAAASL